MTENQEDIESEDLEAWIDGLCKHESRGFIFRERGIRRRLEEYGIDMLDVYKGIERRSFVTRMEGAGRRYELLTETIEGRPMSIILAPRNGMLEVVDLYCY